MSVSCHPVSLILITITDEEEHMYKLATGPEILATIRRFPAQGVLTRMFVFPLHVSYCHEILLRTHWHLPLLRYHYLWWREQLD